MKTLRTITAALLSVLVPTQSVIAQTPPQDSEIVILQSGETLLRWFAKEGRTYFIQASDPNDHLKKWIWSELVESGHDHTISHEVGTTADKAFFRLHYTDTPPPAGVTLEQWDADGDSLPNALELDQQGNPLHPDTNGDGIPDGWSHAHGHLPTANIASGFFQGGTTTNLQAYQLGVQAHPNATLEDHDGDSVENELDADPQDIDVDWKPASVGGYALIEIDVPSDAGHVRDFNDAGHVLFDSGVWKAGVWHELEQETIEGSAQIGDIEWNYFSIGDAGWKLSPTGHVLSIGSSFAYGVDENGDYVNPDYTGVQHLLRRTYLPQTASYQSYSSTLNTVDWFAPSYLESWDIEVLGEDATGRIFASASRFTEPPDHEIWIFDSGLTKTGGYSIPEGYYVEDTSSFMNGGSFKHQATPSGWLAVNVHPLQLDNPSDYYRHTILWNPAGQQITLPNVFTDGFTGLNEMPHLRPALVAAGNVYLPDASGLALKRAHGLSGKNIRTFAGDGTAMTSDGKMWINGKLTPIRDLCPAYGDLVDDGWTFQIQKANKHGAYLVQAQKNGESKVLLLLPVEVVPDYNRDGKIDQADRGKISNEKPWHFWVNSDDDSGTEGGDDIPENSTTPDSGNGEVDGVRDLVDFFPLHFDLKAALEVFPETEFQYFLKHESQSPRPGDAHPNWTPSPTFKVVWYPEAELEANTTGENGVGSFLKNLSRAQGIAGRASNTIPKDGIRIPDDMLTAAKSGKGVGLFEARFATDNPIVLEIKKNSGTTLVEVEMPVKISEVEGMFRSRFLNENLAGGTQGGVPSEPSNWPDADRNGKHFIFVHGYNVSGEQARGWNSEMFKRMFWSGSDAMFTGVAWHGNESQMGTATPDYWRNVHNAFQTSKSVADFVNALPGGGKCIAAHSLGNIVVSSAIKDHGLSVANYYMVDAAAAIEAYSLASTLGNAEMSHPDWRAYDEKLWCSEWHEIFPETDNRHKMTWRDRFGALPNAYNFHSTGEEVLKNGDGTVPGTIGVATSGGVRAWVKQEMSKGFSIGSGGGLFHNGTGGWDFNSHWDVVIYSPYGGGGSRSRTPAEAATIPLAALEENPFFDPFVNDKFHDPALGSAEAAKYDEVSKALAESLPSLTFAAGSNPIQIFNTRNLDMMGMRNGWPENRTAPTVDPDLRGWRHSDIRNMAYLYTHKIFEEFVNLGGLDQ